MERRINTVFRVQDVVQAAFGREYKVKPFGSTCYGADTVDSDVDLVIIVSAFVEYTCALSSEKVGSASSKRLCTSESKTGK